MANDNLPEHGAGAQPSHDPQEADFWTGHVTVCHQKTITAKDGCFDEEQATHALLDEVGPEHCEAIREK